MKMMNKIFGLLLLSMVFVACGSDDDGPVTTAHTLKDADCKITHNLGIAEAGTTISETKTTTLSLDEMLSTQDYNPPITAGVMNLTKGTSIEVKGLTDGLTLENFKLTINGSERNFGTVKTDNSELYVGENQDYFKLVFASMISQQKLAVKASFKPNESLTTSDQVKVNIVFRGNFTYYK